MILFPAIDILDGAAVRLAQGDYNRRTIYHDDAFEQSLEWVRQGAEFLHVVDLNGARLGEPTNHALIERIARECKVPLQVGGGVRSLEAAERLLKAGVTRVILGTQLARKPESVESFVHEFGADRLVAGVDAKSGMVATEGWEESSGKNALDFIETLRDLGLKHLVFTDIARDGMMSGIDDKLYREVSTRAGFPVIVSGGISSLEDLRSAAKLGDKYVEGVITGRAIFEGAFGLAEGIAALKGEGA